MHRIFLILFALISLSYAKIEHVELLANSVVKEGENVVAKGDVLVFSESYLVSADRALYNDTNGELELFGNINMIRGASQSIKSDHIKINLKTDLGKFEPFFTYEDKSKIWLECESAESEENYYVTNDAIVSSCNVQDPDWKIGFSSGELNKNNRFLFLKHAIFYVRSVPIFYLPYFIISTDTTRRTGLLVPSVGYGRKNGLDYQQPIYIAEYDWWDLEIVPQIKTKRGVGAYAKFRFVDTKYSNGSITLGEFKDKSEYQEEENLKNQIHKGVELDYENNNLLAKHLSEDVKDGFLLDFTYLNDIDYLNIKDATNYDSLVTSKANYYLRKDHNFLGLYAKYYIDTSIVDNDTTLQELPTLQYHRFVDTLLFPNLLYSIDTKYHRYTREEGIGAEQFELNIPASIHFDFFDEYLHFVATENIYTTYVKYNQANNQESDQFSRNFHKFSLYTDLAKEYENYIHTLKIGADYIIPSWKHGDIKESFISTEDKEYERLEFYVSQYLFSSGAKKRIKQKISQSFNFKEDEYRYDDLQHELTYYFSDDTYIKNTLMYSHEYERFSKVQTELSAKYNGLSTSLIHTYQKYANDTQDSYLTSSASYQYDSQLSYSSSVNYDFENRYMKSWNAGIKYKKRCWNYNIIYKESITPKLTSAGASSIKYQGVYIAFEFYPLGGTSYDFSHESEIDE